MTGPPPPGDWAAASRWLDLFPGSKLGVTAAVTEPSSGRVHDWVTKVTRNNKFLYQSKL